MSRHRIITIAFLLLLVGAWLLKDMLSLSLFWFILIAGVYVAITACGASVLSMQYFVNVRTAGSRSENAIALTFDDGPVAGKTELILDVLKQHNASAAFFCIGSKVEMNSSLVKRIHDEGHLAGNHSFYHGKTFDLLPAARMAKELSDTDNVIGKVTGSRPRFFRPPYGVTNPMVAKAAKQGRYEVIGWSVRSLDTVIKDREKLFRRVTRKLRGGDIVLFHDHSDSMIALLPDFIEHVRKVGLKIVRLDVLLNEKAYVEKG